MSFSKNTFLFFSLVQAFLLRIHFFFSIFRFIDRDLFKPWKLKRSSPLVIGNVEFPKSHGYLGTYLKEKKQIRRHCDHTMFGAGFSITYFAIFKFLQFQKNLFNFFICRFFSQMH